MRQLTIVLAIVAGMTDVAAGQASCPPGTQCAREDPHVEVERLVGLFTEAMQTKQLAEAEVLAKQIIEMSIEIDGRQSTGAAKALTMLAVVQHHQAQYLPAIQNYRAAIDTIETIEGVLSPELIRPLQGLGESEMALGELGAARDTFTRAVHVSHVNEGPNSVGQIDSLDAISETYRREGQYANALRSQDVALKIQERALGSESAELIPALQAYADWMNRLRLPNRERNTHSRILDLKEEHFGKTDIVLLPTLIELGMSVRSSGYALAEGGLGPELGQSVDEGLDDDYVVRSVKPDYYLRRAMEIADEHPSSDWRLATRTALEIGDYYSRVRRLVKARLAYETAWDRLSGFPEGIRIRRNELESARPLTRPLLPDFFEDQSPVFRTVDTEGFEPASIEVLYDVSKLGKTVNVRIVESRPAGLAKIEEFLLDALKDQVHRPRMQDREIVDSTDLSYVYEFRIRASDE